MIFYKEINFKESPLGKIPSDWSIQRLKDVCETVKGKKPAVLFDEGGENYLPYLTAEYMRTNSNVKWCKKDDPNVVWVSRNDLIMIWDGSYSGDVFFGFEGALASTMIKILPKEKLDKGFLYYFLSTRSNFLRETTSGTGIPHVSKSVFENLLVPFPPIEEQRVIAGVLGVVDSVIAKTDEVIAKTERLKKGLMQTLLTRGIGHKEFKETEIGKIPKAWQVTKLGNRELTEIIMGQSPPSSAYNKEGDGLPFLQGKMEFGEIYPSPVLYCSQPIKIAEQNDILMSVRAPVGDVNVAPYKLCIGRGLAAIRFNSEKADSWFYFYYFQKIKNFLEKIGKGSTFKAITKDDLENLKIPYPPPSEQRRIAEILSNVDRKLEIERNEKAKLERIKRGLMDLLLTGKIRVRAD